MSYERSGRRDTLLTERGCRYMMNGRKGGMEGNGTDDNGEVRKVRSPEVYNMCPYT